MRAFIIFGLIITLPFTAMTQEDDNQLNASEIDSLSMEELSKTFIRLKATEGIKNSKWNSNLHLTMQNLGSRLGSVGIDKAEILKWLGSPDFKSDPMRTIKLSKDEEIMIYLWRGWHDWLYFIIENERVKKCAWWYSFE